MNLAQYPFGSQKLRNKSKDDSYVGANKNRRSDVTKIKPQKVFKDLKQLQQLKKNNA